MKCWITNHAKLESKSKKLVHAVSRAGLRWRCLEQNYKLKLSKCLRNILLLFFYEYLTSKIFNNLLAGTGCKLKNWDSISIYNYVLTLGSLFKHQVAKKQTNLSKHTKGKFKGKHNGSEHDTCLIAKNIMEHRQKHRNLTALHVLLELIPTIRHHPHLPLQELSSWENLTPTECPRLENGLDPALPMRAAFSDSDADLKSKNFNWVINDNTTKIPTYHNLASQSNQTLSINSKVIFLNKILRS